MKNNQFSGKVASFIGLFALIILGFGLYLAHQRERERQAIAGFAQTLEQLGDGDSTAVRLGAIYGLERIAADFSSYHWAIMEVLAAYVRERSPLVPEGQEAPAIEVDIQAATTAIGRRQQQRDPQIKFLDPEKRLDLHQSNLQGANLNRANFPRADLRQVNFKLGNLNLANLSQADLSGANLSQANLRVANLEAANLSGANLRGAELSSADLKQANLRTANLKDTDLSRANFSKADLSQADLSDADLRQANLQDADLRGARFSGNLESLTPDQVKAAKNWDRANYPANFRKLLGLGN